MTFPQGSTDAQTVTVTVNGDTEDELGETFFVDLSNASNADLTSDKTDDRGVGTIVNDDDPSVASISDVSQVEGDSGTSGFVFTVELSGESLQDVAVDYVTTPGTATEGDDYVAASGTLTFTGHGGTPGSGETSKTVA